MSLREDELKQRAARAMWSYAFFRIESALTVSGTILLAFFLPQPFPWWRWWYWLILGVLFEATIVVTSMMDARTGQRVVAAMLRERYQPGDIKTLALRAKVEQALEYREQIEKLIAGLPAGVLRDSLYDDTLGIARWIGSVHELAQRLDAYERDELLHRDIEEVPTSLSRLGRALNAEDDPAVRAQIEDTLRAKREQLDNLKALQNKMEQAAFRLEESVTSLGMVYSQFQLLAARRLDEGSSRRLSEDIREQVRRLQDILSSMDEVYEAT
jgi:hypothetical protein